MHATKNARIASVCSAVVLVGAQLLSPFAILVPKAAADPKGEQNVTICHRTNSVTNPYVKETVAASSVDGNAGDDNGKGDHLLDHTGPVFDVTADPSVAYPAPHNGDQWGDIIPPFDTKGLTYDSPQTSLNWDTAGQAIWDNGCKLSGDSSLKVDKLVDTDGNGTYESGNDTANALGFLWGIDGNTPDQNMGTTVTVAAGTHTVSENTTPGYAFTGWFYTNGTNQNGPESCSNPESTDALPLSITTTSGKTTNITLCNQADPADGSITLTKIVKNSNGGTADPNSFGLSIGGVSVTSGQTLSLPAGDYAINEVEKTGYKFVSINGDNCPAELGDTVSLVSGQHVSCTITNEDVPGQLRVIKDVVNNYGGAAKPSDFTMYVNGNAVDQNKYISEDAGTYSITESGPSGYKQVGIACIDDTTLQTVSYPVNLGLAQSVTCTVTNTDKPASLTVVKVAYPSSSQSFNFTSAKLGDFSLVGDNSTDSSKTFDNLSSGTYTLSEQATDNWQTVYMECRPTDGSNYSVSNNNLSVTLNNGDDVTCYVYNLELNTISGHKFNDVNDNHVWDSGEPTLKNWTITLAGCVDNQEEAPVIGLLTNGQSCANKVNRTTTTDANGAYSFTGLEPGTYTVCEVQQANWTQTYPQDNNGCHEITIDVEQYGEVFTADFGNHPIPQVLGSSTTKLLVNTGMDASRNVIVGLTILSLLGSIHFIGARKKHTA